MSETGIANQVEAFDPTMVQALNILHEQNNLYGSLRVQEENSKMQVKGITQVIHDIKSGKVKIENLSAPYGMGQTRRLVQSDKNELIQTYLKQLQLEENKLKSLTGQRLHRADEVGEQRLKVLRLLWIVMKTQHKFTDEELYEHCKEYAATITQKPYMRTEEQVNETIKKASELIV